MFGAWRRSALLSLAAATISFASDRPQTLPEDPEKLTADLRRLAHELADSVKQFQSHLDREVALHDRGYRSLDGRRIPGADTDLMAGPADLTLATVEKLITARMIAARRQGYEPAALADCDRIQSLILEARNRVAAANDGMRQFSLISARELNSHTDSEMRSRRTELLKARTTATEAAKRALAILPVDLPATAYPEDQVEAAWNLMSSGLPVGKNDGTKVGGAKAGGAANRGTPEDVALPIRIPRGKRVTLIREPFRRVALTDTGIEDGRGRRLLYQEEWEQRQGMSDVKRWAVAVNVLTGQHTLLRRYEVREFPGNLDDVYESYGRDYLSGADLPSVSATPSPRNIASAADETAQSREELDRAAREFRTLIRDAQAHSDALLAKSQSTLDDEMPRAIREGLFAIRGHLARTKAILDAEDRVRRAAQRASAKAEILEALVAWADATAPEIEAPAGDSRALLQAINRSDAEIHSTRAVERDALSALPPDVSKPEAQFPAFMKDVIVRLRGVGPPAARPGTQRCRQEIWRMATSARGSLEVKRTIDFIEIDPHTGDQTRVSGEIQFYRVGSGDSLESIYDENAAQ
jgi:hypothetical protein